MAQTTITLADVKAAHERIKGSVKCTPVLFSHVLNLDSGKNSKMDNPKKRKLFFKCEHLQETGSFKARGALNAVMELKKTKPQQTNVVTYSSGNHGRAVAWASNLHKLNCTVVLTKDTPDHKKKMIQVRLIKLFIYCVKLGM